MSFAKNCLLCCLLLLSPAQAEKVRLLLLHTNDIHGHLEASSGAEASGGFVRVATLIRSIKAAFPGQVVLLDGGDMALGTPTSGLFLGLPTAESMRSVGYDAVAIGNHEFNWGKPAMADLLAAIGAPALCANLVNESDGSHPYRPWTVIEKNGARLGVIGLVAPDTATRAPKAYTQGWQFLPAESAAKQALSELPEVDAVIALTHIGVPADRKLAQALPEISLIVGGHSHTALTELVQEGKVPIVQSGCYCRFLGLLEILVDTDKNDLQVMSYRLLPVDESVAPDPAVSAIVEGYSEKVRPILDRVVARAAVEIVNVAAEGGVDTPLGNFIADALQAESGADLALYNRGGVRGLLPAGPLAVRGLHMLFPFDDHVVVVEASGSQLQEVLEQGAHTQAKLSPSSALKLSIDPEHGQAAVTFRGAPLDPERIYSVTTTQFLATGGDGMSTLAGLKVRQVLPFTRDVMQSFVEKHPELVAPAAGRVTRL